MLTETERKRAINWCLEDVVPDTLPTGMYHNEWFIHQFDFLHDPALADHLGNAYFQARFNYKIMQVLRLKSSKSKGIIQLQILLYSSICEALLNHILERFFKTEYLEETTKYEFVPVSALSKSSKLLFEEKEVCVCKQTRVKQQAIEKQDNPPKVAFMRKHNILRENILDAYVKLYNLRNYAHILKAVSEKYSPKIDESVLAYNTAKDFIEEIKNFYREHPLPITE